MKLRIRGQSVRIRLDQVEVGSLAAGQSIEQQTTFAGSSALVCRVEPSANLKSTVATFISGRLVLRLPIDQLRRWAESDQVGIESQQTIRDDESLHILVEKDFECLHRQDEQDLNTFPNPNGSGST